MVKAADHDFKPDPDWHTVAGYWRNPPDISRLPKSPVIILSIIWQVAQQRFPQVNMVLINLDNGPKKHSRCTQFIQRLVDYVDATQITVQLAYYSPYHSKHNPIERVWGGLDQHWNGSLLIALIPRSISLER